MHPGQTDDTYAKSMAQWSPGIQLFERFVPVPVGLNLTLVLTKRSA